MTVDEETLIRLPGGWPRCTLRKPFQANCLIGAIRQVR
jgi:hypothetical protein